MEPLTRPANLSSQEIYTISCAYLDLKNTLAALKHYKKDFYDIHHGDWEATVTDLEATFPFLTHFEAE